MCTRARTRSANVTGEPESLVGTKEVQGLLDKFFCIFINSIKINGND